MLQFKIKHLECTDLEWNLDNYMYIGSDASCGLYLEGIDIDKKHALLEVREQQLFIKDLRSSSGVRVNDTRVVEAKLTDGDVICIGHQELMIHDLLVKKKQFSLVSLNEKWSEQLKRLSTVADSNFPILLLGPSGAGKDVIAQNIHQISRKKDSPFISVNCSALTETLVESELFGHIKGSFTGAVADRKGAFEAARGGTLFLDEIGDLPYAIQAKLLRALENNEIRPVGSDRTIKTNVRIIAATHQQLHNKIREGSFRNDLFFRLNVITVTVPALKERSEDFETILYHFAKQMRVRFSHGAICVLKKYEWPGNIRELKNIVARASVLFHKEYITEKYIDQLLDQHDKLINFESTQPQQLSVIKEIEKQMIVKRLIANQGNQKRTALDLGMPKSTLHDRLKNYNINANLYRGYENTLS